MAALLCFVLFLALFLDYLFYPWQAPLPVSDSGNRGTNGLWLRYPWYFGQHSEQEVTQLGKTLTRRQIRFAYFHVRHVDKNGKLHFRYPAAARRLNTVLKRSAPGVTSIAWIYVGNTRAGTASSGIVTDLSDARVRRQMVQEATFLVNECGFDGVQWDYEVCANGDPYLLALLRETRATLPPGKVISVATALLAPGIMQRFGYGWSEAYFSDVARNSDQMAIMAYDSGAYLPRAYAWLVSDQVARVCPAIRQANPRCLLLIGVPTYEQGGPSHHARAENLAVAIRGVRAGFQQLSAEDQTVFGGIAPFADYTTDAQEWHQYEAVWLKNRP